MTHPTPARPGCLETTLASGGVEVVFRWADDRWVHTLHAHRPDGSRTPADWHTSPALPSEEVMWPSSPPLVELSEVPLPHGSALVGVGSAGKTHYSVSVAAEPEGGLRFEFACRLATAAGWLGTTYAASGTSQTLAIEPLGDAVAQTVAAPGNGPALLQIVPAPAAPSLPGRSAKGSTVQWSYRVWVPQVG